MKKILTIIFAIGCLFTTSCFAADNKPDAANDEMLEYAAQTRKMIKNNWYPPVKAFENSATILLTIDKKGTLVKCSLTQPSPNEGFNNSLIEAASKVNYPPLPASFKGKYAEIGLDFSMQRRHINKN